MQKIREQVLLRRDKVYQDNEGEVRNRWNFEDAVSLDFAILRVTSIKQNVLQDSKIQLGTLSVKFKFKLFCLKVYSQQ